MHLFCAAAAHAASWWVVKTLHKMLYVQRTHEIFPSASSVHGRLFLEHNALQAVCRPMKVSAPGGEGCSFQGSWVLLALSESLGI